jgi:hypothetical protein
VLLPTGASGWVLSSPSFMSVFGPVDNIPAVEAATITPTASNTPNRPLTQTIIARETLDARATAIVEASNEQATQDTRATVTGRSIATATQIVIATQNARASSTQEQRSINATASQDAQATNVALITQNAIATDNAQATANVNATNEQASQNAQATNDAIATQNAQATANANATNEQASQNAQATNDAIATENAQATANANATNEQASQNAQATNDAIATENAQATANANATNEQASQNAQVTANVIATQNAQATNNAITNATATQNAQATLDVQATLDTQATVDAQATQNAQATIDVQLIIDANAAATQAALPGRMPYLQDFSDGLNALEGSAFDAEEWTVGPGAGEGSVLVGSARISQAFTLLGNSDSGLPEWVEAGLTDYVLSFRLNMDAGEGTRVILRYTPGQAYYAIDIATGRINIKRGERGYDPEIDRDRERFIGNPRGYTSVMRLNEWYDITIWVQGRLIYVFVDSDLVAIVVDGDTPLPASGDILFQTLNRTRDIYFDDIVVQSSNPASDHFESRLPIIWNTSTVNGEISLEREDDTQYVRLWRDGEFTAAVNIDDLDIRTRIYSEEGGYDLYLRESDEGALRLTTDAGNLQIAVIDSDGTAQAIANVTNFYNRNLWEDMRIRYVGNRLEIWMGGQQEFSANVSDLPSGQIRFVTTRQDVLRIDDFLLIEPVR